MGRHAPRTIYLVRHAETAWNKELRYQGQTDIPLNDEGRQQARELRERLFARRPILFDPAHAAVVSSDLSRARESAELAFACDNRTIHLEAGLRELRHGLFEGLSRQEIIARYPAEHERFVADPGYIVEGSEARLEARERAVAAVTRWLDKLPHPHLIVMTHGGILRQLMLRSMGDGEMPTHVSFRNLSVNVLSVEGDGWIYAGQL